MKAEVHCACEFFSRMLESKHLPHQFASQFRTRLEELLSERFKDHWDTRNPSRGSAYRCIRINSKMDPVVSEAAKATGLKDISKYLPAEFTMWIDPRDVSYRFGEDGSICSCPLDFMVTRSEWSSSETLTSPSLSTAAGSYSAYSTPASRRSPTSSHQHHYHHTMHSPTPSPVQPSRSKSSPSSSHSQSASSYYHHQVYRDLSSRLIQVQV